MITPGCAPIVQPNMTSGFSISPARTFVITKIFPFGLEVSVRRNTPSPSPLNAVVGTWPWIPLAPVSYTFNAPFDT